MPETGTPLPPPDAADLEGHSAEALVDAIIRLTHMVHTFDVARAVEAATAYRARRDLARAELLRRCHGPGPELGLVRKRGTRVPLAGPQTSAPAQGAATPEETHP